MEGLSLPPWFMVPGIWTRVPVCKRNTLVAYISPYPLFYFTVILTDENILLCIIFTLLCIMCILLVLCVHLIRIHFKSSYSYLYFKIFKSYPCEWKQMYHILSILQFNLNNIWIYTFFSLTCIKWQTFTRNYVTYLSTSIYNLNKFLILFISVLSHIWWCSGLILQFVLKDHCWLTQRI